VGIRRLTTTPTEPPIVAVDQNEDGKTSTVQVLSPEAVGKGRRRLIISPLVNKKFDEWLRSSRSKVFERKMLPIAGLQRYYQKRKDAYVAREGSPDAFDQAFDDMDISVAVDGWSSLDAELAKYLHEDVGRRDEAPTAKFWCYGNRDEIRKLLSSVSRDGKEGGAGLWKDIFG
jgi:hypothetical protein